MNDKKAILFIFSQPWCGACTKLKANFMQDGEKLLDISKDFLLINVGGDDNNKFGVRHSWKCWRGKLSLCSPRYP